MGLVLGRRKREKRLQRKTRPGLWRAGVPGGGLQTQQGWKLEKVDHETYSGLHFYTHNKPF